MLNLVPSRESKKAAAPPSNRYLLLECSLSILVMGLAFGGLYVYLSWGDAAPREHTQYKQWVLAIQLTNPTFVLRASDGEVRLVLDGVLITAIIAPDDSPADVARKVYRAMAAAGCPDVRHTPGTPVVAWARNTQGRETVDVSAISTADRFVVGIELGSSYDREHAAEKPDPGQGDPAPSVSP
jgi:hypothetical protein